MFSYRPYQLEARDTILSDLKECYKCGLILPTGSGKTEVFIAIVDEWLKANPDQSVLVLSHLDILTSQTNERFHLRTPDIYTGILKGSDYPYADSKVIISTMQTSRSANHISILKHRLIKPIGLIIVDEAHHLMTDSYDTATGYFPQARIIGCTATPFRAAKIMTNYFDKISFSMSLQELIDLKYLVPPKLHQIIKRSDKLDDIIAMIVNLYKTQTPDKKAVIYMQTIEDAKKLRMVFENEGITTRAVTSELTGDYRDQILDTFQRGSTDILTTVNVLTAGVDLPCLETIYMPYATGSPTQYLQRIGRGLRLCPERDKTHCDVFVFGDAPSISSEMYERIHVQILNKGGQKKEYDTYTKEFDYNDYDPSSEIYTWNQSVLEAIKTMRSAGMDTFSNILNNKRFPPKFLKDIKKLLEKLPHSKSTLPGGDKPASTKQIQTLLKNRFRMSDIRNITKSEANSMISVIFKMSNFENNEFIIPSGKHQGKHVAELSHKYRWLVLKKFPHSAVGEMIVKWNKRRKDEKNC